MAASRFGAGTGITGGESAATSISRAGRRLVRSEGRRRRCTGTAGDTPPPSGNTGVVRLRAGDVRLRRQEDFCSRSVNSAGVAAVEMPAIIFWTANAGFVHRNLTNWCVQLSTGKCLCGHACSGVCLCGRSRLGAGLGTCIGEGLGHLLIHGRVRSCHMHEAYPYGMLQYETSA